MKYKLIKEYPGSPDLGYISEPKDTLDTALHYWSHTWFDPGEYPEFWEDVSRTYYVNLNLLVSSDRLVKDFTPQSWLKEFESKEDADKYLSLIKPSISKQQILDILGEKDFIGTEYLKEQLNI